MKEDQSIEKQSTNPLAGMFRVPTPDFNSVLPMNFEKLCIGRSFIVL